MMKIVRRSHDTNSIWDDISIGERNDTHRWFRRTVTRFVFTMLGVIVVSGLVVGGVTMWNFFRTQPNVTDVIAKAKLSTFEVWCGDSAGTAVAVTMPLPDKYETGLLSAAHIFDSCAEGTEVDVVYQDREYTALLFRKDPQTAPPGGEPGSVDLALLYLTHSFPTLDAAPAAIQGDWAVAFGNPWSQTNYATIGIVSDLTAGTYLTDASVNEGNSGGPLLDSRGRVLGIASYIEIMSNLYDDNPQGIYDRAEGIATFQRLNLACEHLYFNVTECPFQN